jgi:type IV pilus assembly protein PilM
MRRLVRRILKTTRFRAKRPLVGLDIGSSRLKAVQLTRAGQSYRVAAFATEPMPAGAVVDGLVTDAKALSAAIGRLFARADVGPAHVAAALPGTAAIVKRVTLPAMTGRELDDAVGWEAEQHVPYPLTDVQWRYEPLGGATGTAKTIDVLLVAARRDSIAALAAVISDAGQTPVAIEVGALAVQHAHDASYGSRSGAALALLDIGASTTTVSIAVNGRPAFVRQIALGGEAYTEALQRAFHLSFEAAEELKRQPPDEPSRRVEFDAVQRLTTDALLGEIRKTFDFFCSTTATDRIDSLVLTGGGSLLAGLPDALEQRLNTATTVLDPFRLLAVRPEHFAGDRHLSERTLATAMGLALHREDGR